MTVNDTLSLHIQIGKVICSGTILAKTCEQKEFQVVKGISHSISFLLRNELEEDSRRTDLSKERLIDIVVSSIFKSLFSKNEIRKENIDYLTAHWSDYSKLRDPAEITDFINKILNKGQEKFDNTPTTFRPKPPKIIGNELKCKALRYGGRTLTESYSGLKDTPPVFLDFSTFSSGISVKKDTQDPPSGLFSGLGMIILDFLARGHGDIDENFGTISQIPESDGEIYGSELSDFVSEITELIDIKRIPSGTQIIGNIPVDVESSYDKEIRLIGCDVGTNGDELNKIKTIGKKAAAYGTASLNELLVRTFARLVGKTIRVMKKEELISNASSICISTRNDLSRYWKKNLVKTIKEIGFEKTGRNIYFLEDPSSIGFQIQNLKTI